MNFHHMDRQYDHIYILLDFRIEQHVNRQNCPACYEQDRSFNASRALGQCTCIRQDFD